jgi:hypothetical protein
MSFLTKDAEVIEIQWEGPTPFTRLQDYNRDADYGVYQIYGTHAIFGSDTLLYIGKAERRTFAQRLADHERVWVDWEPSTLQVYLGRLGGLQPTHDQGGEWKEWENQIDRVERLLVFFCTPPYNSKGLNGPVSMRPTIVLNYGLRHRLPLEVSSLYEDGEYASHRDLWKPYTVK